MYATSSSTRTTQGANCSNLPSAERGPELNDGLAALTVESARDLDNQQAHSFGDVRAFEELGGVLILGRGALCADGAEVRCELGLRKGALKDVFVRDSDLAPGLH